MEKLGHFGFARQIPKFEAGKSFFHISASYGIPGYQAPKVDLFSFGVVSLLHMNSLKKPWIQLSWKHSVGLGGLRLKKTSANWNVRILYEPLQHLAKRCLSVRHRTPNMDEVLMHSTN